MLRTRIVDNAYYAADRTQVNLFTHSGEVYSCYGSEVYAHQPHRNLRLITSLEQASDYHRVIVQCPICKLVYRLLKMKEKVEIVESEAKDLFCKINAAT